jgi:hypothetical protein
VQVRCIKPFGGLDVGDVAEVPDGAAVDPVHWEPAAVPSLPLAPVSPAAIPVKEGM